MGEHTPGPWLASRFNPLVEQHDTGRVVAQCDVGARHGQFRITGDEALANARLIAAAPALLEALKSMKDAAIYNSAASATKAETVHAAADAKLRAAMDLADAAITAAEGR